MIEIPLTSAPEQRFTMTLEGQKYEFRVIVNSRTSKWSMDISQNGVDIVSGVHLVGGVDIFKQYNLPIKNAYVVNLDNRRLDPNKNNLGTSAKLFLLTDEEISL